MATNYPSSIDSFTNPSASDPLTSPSHAAQHANANDAIEAIETELGTTPKGTAASVKARLDAIEDGTRIAGVLPIGSVTAYAGGSAPTGWLLCAGQTVSRTTYAALFAVVGTTYGTGNGSTTFNVPDLRGRVVAGVDNMGGTSANRLTNPAGTTGGIDGDVLGGTGGAETHALTEAQLAAHKHEVAMQSDGSLVPFNLQLGTTGNTLRFSSTGDLGDRNGADGTHSTGSNTGHNNVQPTIILNYIIRAL